MKFTSIARIAAVVSLVLAPMATAAPSGLTGRFDQLDRQLEQITSSGERLRSKTFLTVGDVNGDGLDEEYAPSFFNLALEVLGDAKLASDSKGARGDVQGLKLFEDLAQVHEERLGREVGDNDEFMARIRSGEVKIDPKFVATWTPRERAGFKAFLSPSAVKSYPSLALVEPAAMTQVQAAAEVTDQACSAALPCVVPCANKNWSACASCIAKAIPTVRAAYSRFQSCWAGSGKPRWVPLSIWRVQCLAAFIRVLA